MKQERSGRSTAVARDLDRLANRAKKIEDGLGTMSSQASNNVNITGGSVTGITDLAIADGGTGASTAGAARTNLGLGTIATQDSSSVSITGGSVTGITDLAIADGGTGSSTASGARTNLGLGSAAVFEMKANRTNVTTDTAGKFTVTFSTAFSTIPSAVVATVQNTGTAHRTVVINAVRADGFDGTLFAAASGTAPATDVSVTRTLNWIAVL